VYSAKSVPDQLVEQCASLFSRDYGVWGAKGPSGKAGKPVTLSSKRVREQCLFNDSTCFLAVALVNDRVVGHAFYTRFWFEPLKGVQSMNPCDLQFYNHAMAAGHACWITQLCVDKNFRNQGIAKRLCGMVWAADDDVASGLITSHPYAVRALEAATGERCQVAAIREHASALISASGVPYVQKLVLESKGVTINTNFFVDHSEINLLIDQEIKRTDDGRFPWELGTLPDGHEFFAFTFHSSIGSAEKSARALVSSRSVVVSEDLRHRPVMFCVDVSGAVPADLLKVLAHQSTARLVVGNFNLGRAAGASGSGAGAGSPSELVQARSAGAAGPVTRKRKARAPELSDAGAGAESRSAAASEPADGLNSEGVVKEPSAKRSRKRR
jgi:hypothetical protein